MGSLPKSTNIRNLVHDTFRNDLNESDCEEASTNENIPPGTSFALLCKTRKESPINENGSNACYSNRNSTSKKYSTNRNSVEGSPSYNTLIIHNPGDDQILGNQSIHCKSGASPRPLTCDISKCNELVRNNLKLNDNDISVQEITEIPDDYLNQSFVLKHLAKEVMSPISQNDSTLKSPVGSLDYKMSHISNIPASYGNWSDDISLQQTKESAMNPCSSEENVMFQRNISKSQPDLSTVVTEDRAQSFKRGVSAPKSIPRRPEFFKGDVWSSVEVIEMLLKENNALKSELENCYKKVAKTQKLEHEIFKVHKAQEELIQSCDRRERLERVARNRFQCDNIRLQELNRALRGQIDLLSTQISRTVFDQNVPEVIKRELNKRDILINQLMAQNKELVAAKERQEIELTAQRVTLQEQRTHIDILETALTNAQGNVVKLEEENRKKQVYVERVAQLQRALSSLQLASDRREQTERKLRLQLERELQRSKLHNENCSSNNGQDMLGDSDYNLCSDLKRKLREKDEKILKLEGDCTKWEQRYLEENAMRQAAIEAASIPKDAKIAALEKNSKETEKMIAEARNEKIRHLDEVHEAQKRFADLESRTKDLESKLAERDAMIKVLHKHTYEKDMNSVLNRSPHHTPHGSLSRADIDHVLASTVSREVNSALNNSSGYSTDNSFKDNGNSYHVPSYSKYDHNKNFEVSNQMMDNRLNDIDSQLDSQLLSKVGDCETFY